MKLLFLSVDFPLPVDRGFRSRTLAQLLLLSRLKSVTQLTVLSLRNMEVDQIHIEELREAMPGVQIDSPVFQPIHMRQHPDMLPRLAWLRLFNRIPYIVGKCDNATMRALVTRHLQTGTYDVVYLGALGMTAYLDDIRRLAPHARVVLEQHNVEWTIFDRLATGARPLMRRLLEWEARAVRRFEARQLRLVNSVIAISDADANSFRELAGIEATVVPPFVEARSVRTESASAPALVYVGVLGWQPNILGLDWFCREVWPLIRAALPEVTLTIAGGGLPVDASQKPILPDAWNQPGIRALGFVPDLETVYRDTSVLIAPIIGGSGVRMKLIEAFAAGMPTVTTTDGAAGLGVGDGRELLIGDTPSEFADRTVRLLGDAALRAQLRDCAYGYLRTHHSEALGRSRMATAIGIQSAGAADRELTPTGIR